MQNTTKYLARVALFLVGFFSFEVCSQEVAGGPVILVDEQVDPRGEEKAAVKTPEVLEMKGEWGQLELVPLMLEQPDHAAMYLHDMRWWNQGVVWGFGVESVDEVRAILVGAGLNQSLVERLTTEDVLKRSADSGLYEIRPDRRTVLGLTAEQRMKLYPRLEPKVDHNVFHLPYSLPPGGLDSVLHVPTGISPERIDLLKRLSYQVGTAYRLADIQVVFADAESDAERLRIVKTLGREPSFEVRLKVDENTDPAMLAAYWGEGGREDQVKAQVISAMETQGVDSVNLVHLLPPVPRKLVNSFPSIYGEGIAELKPDCFWTSTGFFADSTPDRHLDFAQHTVLDRYDEIREATQLGDLILFEDTETGKWLHVCNLIAGDLVFTKNGKSSSRPWIFSTRERVQQAYLLNDSVKLKFYRLKPEFRP